MQIGKRSIGPAFPPLIIAELGINHGGDLRVAKRMVELAAKSGAECIKHQTHFVDDEMTEDAKLIMPPNATKSIWDVISESALTPTAELELKRYAESLGLIYLSTPFSRKAVDFLDDAGVLAFKIGSGEADNIPFLRHVVSKGRPIIMSTGMQSIESLKESIGVLEDSGVEYALLECTNLYPSPPEHVSLKGIASLAENFPNAVVGFSDHSIGPEIALASVALGASIVERHFTDSKYRLGPDIACSMDPSELRYLVDKANLVFAALQSEKTRTMPEEDVYRFARGSVVSDRDLNPGDIIRESDIWVRRPGDGELKPSDFYKVIGRKVLKNISKNKQLSWSDFE